MTWLGLGGSGWAGYFKPKTAAFRPRCHQTQLAAHGLGRACRNGKPKPGPGLRAARLAPEEGLEKSALFGLWNAWALVENIQA